MLIEDIKIFDSVTEVELSENSREMGDIAHGYIRAAANIGQLYH